MTDISSYDPWRIDPANPCRVVVVHEGLSFWAENRVYGSRSEHVHEIAVYATPEEAAEAVRRKNGGMG